MRAFGRMLLEKCLDRIACVGKKNGYKILVGNYEIKRFIISLRQEDNGPV